MKNFDIDTVGHSVKPVTGLSEECVDYVLERFFRRYNGNGLLGYADCPHPCDDTRTVYYIWDSHMKEPAAEELEKDFDGWYGDYMQKVCVDLAKEACG